MTDRSPSRRLPLGVALIVLVIIAVPLITIVMNSRQSGQSVSQTLQDLTSTIDEPADRASDSARSTSRFTGRFEHRPIGRTPTENPYITHVTAADLDQDGLLDVIVSDATTNRVSWIRQESPGRFQERIISPSIVAPARTQVIDFDQDGDLDLLIAGLGSLFPTNEKLGTVVILENKGDQTFTPHTIARGLPRVADVRGVDLDADGDLDLAVAQFGADVGQMSWMENTGDWTIVNHPLHQLSGTIHVIPDDLDEDGDPDLVCIVSQEWEEIYVFLNDGSGTFTQRLLYGSSNDDYGSSGISLADLDADGDTDILYTNGDAFDYTPPRPRPWHGVQWLENTGSLNFVFHRLADYPGAYGSSAVDVDQDRDLDIVVVSSFNYWENPAAQSVIWLENQGGGQFTRHNVSNTPSHQITVAIGDYNDDGRPDLVTGGMHFYAPYDRIGRVTLWLNTGSDTPPQP